MIGALGRRLLLLATQAKHTNVLDGDVMGVNGQMQVRIIIIINSQHKLSNPDEGTPGMRRKHKHEHAHARMHTHTHARTRTHTLLGFLAAKL